MDSMQTNTKLFVEGNNHRCITQIMAVAEERGFRLYVAWEWKGMAKEGVFGFAKSRQLYQQFTWSDIQYTAGNGWDIGGTGQEKEIFKNLF